MLNEIRKIQQVAGEPKRKWFTSGVMDLIVWVDGENVPIGFQLSYDKGRTERALTWSPEYGFSHWTVDDGEQLMGGRYKATPVLVPGGVIDIETVGRFLNEQDTQLPVEIAQFLRQKINAFSLRKV